jgi:hypothetical protein
MLKPLGIGPDNVGPKNGRVRGYKRSQFEEAFARYLPPEGVSECTPAHQAANTGTSDISEVHTEDNGCAVGKCEKPNNDGLVGGCALAKGGIGEKTHVRTARARSDDLPYTGPVVEVPDLGPDPLDEYGVPVTEPGLSQRRIRELRQHCLDLAEAQRQYGGEIDQAEIEEDLRVILREEVLPEFVEVEVARVMQAVFAA